jgi:hypothetical protein
MKDTQKTSLVRRQIQALNAMPLPTSVKGMSTGKPFKLILVLKKQ